MIGAAVPRTPGRAAVRLAIGFLIGVALWVGLSLVYERTLAAGAETLLRWTEWPAVTRLEARRGEILIERNDFPPAAPRPGLPAADIHFNFVILVALFALASKPWRGEWLGRFALVDAECAAAKDDEKLADLAGRLEKANGELKAALLDKESQPAKERNEGKDQ